jgi:hypothetical protein
MTSKIEKESDYADVDIKKIQEIQQIQNLIFSDNENKKTQPKKQLASPVNPSNSNKLAEHGNFLHNFNEYNIRANEIVPLYFLKHHPTDEDFSLNSSLIPIITEIIINDKDSLEITRIHLYSDFYNKAPYCTEKISIKRKTEKDKDEVLLSFFEDKMKKEITSLTADGVMTKVVKFKMFRNPNELLFLQNIYYYRSILETYFYYRQINKVQSKKEFSSLNMYYHEFMKNLF